MRASAVAGIVFANVNDDTLGNLTSKRSTASVPFGAKYRMIDFSLSNLVNAGVSSVGIITKENYCSLIDHLGSGVYWDLDRKNGGIFLLPPYGSSELRRYSGTVDALHGAFDYISKCSADYIIMCDSNIIANVDLTSAINMHVSKKADVTIVYHSGSVPDKMNEIMLPEFDEDQRVKRIVTSDAKDISDYYMGITIVGCELLKKLIKEADIEGLTSFNKDVLARQVNNLKIYGYEHKEYLAVINDVSEFYRANMDLLDCEVRHQLFNPERAIFTKTRDDMPTRYGTKACVTNCVIADGCIINGTVKNSILFKGVNIEKDAVVENSILMQQTSVGKGVILKDIITDKNVVIGDDIVLKGTSDRTYYINKNQII